MQKIEKVAALKTQLWFHAEQSTSRERRAALEEEEQRLKILCEIAALEESIEAIKATDSLEGSNRDEWSVVSQETANGKRDRILNSMNNSVSSYF